MPITKVSLTATFFAADNEVLPWRKLYAEFTLLKGDNREDAYNKCFEAIEEGYEAYVSYIESHKPTTSVIVTDHKKAKSDALKRAFGEIPIVKPKPDIRILRQYEKAIVEDDKEAQSMLVSIYDIKIDDAKQMISKRESDEREQKEIIEKTEALCNIQKIRNATKE